MKAALQALFLACSFEDMGCAEERLFGLSGSSTDALKVATRTAVAWNALRTLKLSNPKGSKVHPEHVFRFPTQRP